jgi:hypothetical protein
MNRSIWLKELREAEKKPRILVEEENPAPFPSDREQCVICGKRTTTWLHPENAPLCSNDCLAAYLKDPTVYDPRELHSRPSPRLVNEEEPKPPPPPPPKKPRAKRKSSRWEPDEDFIKEAQDRIAGRRRGKDDD